MAEIKPQRYYQQWENLERELKKVIRDNNGKFPKQTYFRTIRRNDLSRAISLHHGGVNSVRQRMGYESIKKENGYWTPKRMLSELKKIKKENNLPEYPSGKDLEDLGYTALKSRVQSKYGGIIEFLKSQGIKTNKPSRNDWKNLDYAIQKAKRAIKKNRWEKLPSGDILSREGYSSLSCAISKYHGGFIEFRKILGETRLREKPGSWKSLEFALEKAKEIMDKNDWDELPGAYTLMKYPVGGSLSVAIINYHGGYIAFREKLLEYMGRPTENKHLESLLEKYAGGKK